jgi:hypothetical protein
MTIVFFMVAGGKFGLELSRPRTVGKIAKLLSLLARETLHEGEGLLRH